MPGEPVPRTSEDCLYLNIWRPLRRADEPLPVMVWIYGGGFSNGATSYALYSGEGLASRGVIVVNIAYRVGPLGFLAHPELTAESPEGVSGNYGLLDQIAALQWVRENIDAFGGDAGNVTVFGQSAGATSISALMASPLAEGLFHRAIGQSGGLFEPLEIAPRYELSNAELDGEAYAASLGVSSLPELRALPAGALFEGQAGMVTHPVIDSYVLPEVPYDVFSSGRQHRVPVLVGSNADEARSLMADPEEIRAETFATEIAARWGQLPAPLMEAYAFETDDEARQAASDFERDLRFGWDVWTWARLTAAAGEPAFYYYFTHEPPFPRGSLYEDWGASHFAELWYMFDHLNQESWSWAESDTVLANLMTAYWTNFAKSGDPNAAGLPEWPRFTNESERVLYLATPVSVGGVPNLETLQVFDSVYSTIRQQD